MGRRRVGIIGGETCLLLLVLLPVVTGLTYYFLAAPGINRKMGLRQVEQGFASFVLPNLYHI